MAGVIHWEDLKAPAFRALTGPVVAVLPLGQEDQQRHQKRIRSDTTGGPAATPKEDQQRHQKKMRSDTSETRAFLPFTRPSKSRV